MQKLQWGRGKKMLAPSSMYPPSNHSSKFFPLKNSIRARSSAKVYVADATPAGPSFSKAMENIDTIEVEPASADMGVGVTVDAGDSRSGGIVVEDTTDVEVSSLGPSSPLDSTENQDSLKVR